MTPSPQRKRWSYLIVILMLLALVAFSLLPLLSSIIGQPQFISSSASAQSSSLTTQQKRLEIEALGYEKVLEREPENQAVLRGLLEVRLQQGDFEGAISPLEALAHLNPDSAYAILLAQTKQQMGDSEGAIDAYRQVLALDSANLVALESVTNLLLEQEQSEKAISLIEKALETATNAADTASIQLLLGLVYTAQHRDEEAIALYDRLQQSHPEDFRPVLSKALVLKNQNQAAEAQSLFEQAASLATPEYQDLIKTLAAQEEAAGGAA